MAPDYGMAYRGRVDTSDSSWIDFSGIENPFGTPDSFVKAIIDAVSGGLLCANPDRNATSLCNALSRSLALPQESFLVGNDVSAMISAVAQTFEPGQVGVSTPCPTEYVLSLSNSGHRIKRIPLSSSFVTPAAEVLARKEITIDAALLSNPSWPTSRLLSQATLESYLDTCSWVIVDERSIELTLGGRSFADLVEQHRNLVVIQSFNEQYALPGAHVSYCIAHPDTVSEIRRFYDNSCVTMFPAVLAEPSMVEHPKLEGVRGFLYSEIPWMQTMLSLLPGVDIIPAEANYVMCSFKNDGSLSRSVPNVAELAAQLNLEGYGIRMLEGTPGLGSSDYYCVAVRTRQQNELLIETMRTLITS